MWRVSRRQTPESYSCHLISLHPVWKIKIPLLQLCNMTHIWGSFLFLHIFFSNCSCVQTHYPATLCTHMDLKVAVLPDARRQFSLHIRVNKVLDIFSSPFHIFTFLYNVWARTEHPIKSGFDFALKEITILIFKRQSFASFLPGVPSSPYIFLRAA